MSQYFPNPFRSFVGNITVKVKFSNYPTKSDLKILMHGDTSTFAPKTHLISLKTKVFKLDIEKLAPVSVDLSKFSDVVKNDVVKKVVYDKLAAKVNNIDTNAFVLKTKYQTEETELEKKIPDVSDIVKKAKPTELENKIPDISSLATKAALFVVENKIASVASLVKKIQIFKTKTHQQKTIGGQHKSSVCTFLKPIKIKNSFHKLQKHAFLL